MSRANHLLQLQREKRRGFRLQNQQTVAGEWGVGSGERGIVEPARERIAPPHSPLPTPNSLCESHFSANISRLKWARRRLGRSSTRGTGPVSFSKCRSSPVSRIIPPPY